MIENNLVGKSDSWKDLLVNVITAIAQLIFFLRKKK
jgi:hypothetical protein